MWLGSGDLYTDLEVRRAGDSRSLIRSCGQSELKNLKVMLNCQDATVIPCYLMSGNTAVSTDWLSASIVHLT